MAHENSNFSWRMLFIIKWNEIYYVLCSEGGIEPKPAHEQVLFIPIYTNIGNGKNFR